MKKLLSIILMLVLLISSVNTVVFATGGNYLTLGNAVTVTEDTVTYTFTTEEAGPYVASSEGDGYLFASIYEEDGDCVTTAYQNQEDGMGFYIEAVLAADSVYSIEVYNRFPQNVATNYALTVDYKGFNGALSIGSEVKTNAIESYHSFTPSESGYYIIYTTGDENTYGKLYDGNAERVYSDDNMSFEGNYRLEYYLNAGETYSVYTKIYEAPEEFDVGICVRPFSAEASIEENVIHTVNDNWDILTFTPSKTATYIFFSEEEENYEITRYGQIYNSDFEMISWESNSMYSEGNFYVEADLTAGETYYLDTRVLWCSEVLPGAYNVKICELSPITSLEIVPLDGTVAGVNEDLHCELIINPEVHKSEEITWYIEPERVGRIEYSGDWGASIELHSPGIANVVAYSESGAEASYQITCEGELPELQLNKTADAYMEYDSEIHSYYFTAEEEGSYGVLSRGDDLDLKVAIYRDGETTPFKKGGSKGKGDNFNLQFYNLEPGTKYIVEVTTEYDEEDYNDHSGNYEIMAYKTTEEVEGIELSVGDNYTVYTGEDYEFSVSLIPETADQYALEYITWNLTGDEIGMQTVYGRSFVEYRFYEAGTATLTASTDISDEEDGGFTASCVLTCKEVGYNNIALDEVKTVRADGHYSEGWFSFVAPEDGEYTFYSTGNEDIYIAIYNYEYDYAETLDDDSGSDYNFFYTIELAAGEEFCFETYTYSWKVDEYKVSVCKKHYPESITVVQKPSDYYSYGYFSVIMGNGGATYDRYDEIIWTIDDKSVAEISWYYNGGMVEVYLIKRGVATITAQTPEGLTDSYTFCSGIADVNEDEEFDVLDLVKMSSILLDTDPSSYYAADINEDGEVNSADMVLTKKMLFASF